MPGKKRSDRITDEVLCAEYESVYRYVLTLCRSDADAQDITQETFLKAMKASGNYSGNSSLYTWLCAIARNLWLDKCRRQKREAPLSGDLDSGVSIEQHLEDRDFSLRIHKKLHEMPEPYREVFTLRVFGQLPFKDIVGLFEKTENWARVTCHRARKMIIEKLKEDGLL